ncbi:unnamed protein product [Miscanthus lutarioriparius]|uniref:VQ domain-containing protein n=1 Tax=Miscanthus lutarioriparius TaxID=422564 RepID=A0A811NR53_9POAL|nr:unnamed protein product [Miscanthus lutarioriparius]
MSSSSAAAKAKRGVVSSLQGPRPLPLSLPGTTSSSSPPPRQAKRPRVAVDDGGVGGPPPAAAPGPVILYEHTPKVIHARPDEFKALVQRLTGRQPAGTAGGGDQGQEAVLRSKVPSSQSQQDPLVLTLGQQQVPPPPPLPLDDHHHTPPVLPSPPGGAGGFLLSPGSFLFSPATMQAIQELIS